MGKRSFIYKSKGGMGSRKYWTSQKREEDWREIKVARVKTAAACLGELTIYLVDAKQRQPV